MPRRFSRWHRKGVRAQLLAAVIDEPDPEWLMIDANPAKAQQRVKRIRDAARAYAASLDAAQLALA